MGSMTVQALSLLGVLVMLRVGLWEIAACYGLQGPPAQYGRQRGSGGCMPWSARTAVAPRPTPRLAQ
jgi:hypothetical protein